MYTLKTLQCMVVFRGKLDGHLLNLVQLTWDSDWVKTRPASVLAYIAMPIIILMIVSQFLVQIALNHLISESGQSRARFCCNYVTERIQCTESNSRTRNRNTTILCCTLAYGL